MSNVRIIVTGDRRWYCRDLADRVMRGLMAKHPAGFVIVHGGAVGVDWVFSVAAERAGVATEPHPADWNRYGKSAIPIRNQTMVDLGAVVCLAFKPGYPFKGGTADCVRRAIRAGIPTWVTMRTDGDPVRLDNHVGYRTEVAKLPPIVDVESERLKV